MKYLFGFLIFVLLSTRLSAQEIDTADLATIVKKIKTIAFNDADLQDLDPISKAIGNSRVVVLGEQDHGDATSLQAKARLVKFLHEKMGFKVLAFEADAYSLLSLQKEAEQAFYVDSVKNSIPAYWSQTKDMQSLWEYLSANKDLKLAGFDIGLNTSHVRQHFNEELNQKLSLLPFAKSKDYSSFLATVDTLIQTISATTYTSKEKENFFKSLRELTLQVKQQFSNDELLQRQLYALWAKADYSLQRNYREKHMAANLSWLIKHKYPNEKIIVWTASFHAVKDIYSVVENVGERAKRYHEAVDKDSVETMIQILKRDASIPLYVLNMVGLSGMYTLNAWTGIANTADSIRIPRGNIERAVSDLAGDLFFMDLQSLPAKHWLQFPIPMIAMLHRNTYNARWPKVFDGLFFIRNMKPLTLL